MLKSLYDAMVTSLHFITKKEIPSSWKVSKIVWKIVSMPLENFAQTYLKYNEEQTPLKISQIVVRFSFRYKLNYAANKNIFEFIELFFFCAIYLPIIRWNNEELSNKTNITIVYVSQNSFQ